MTWKNPAKLINHLKDRIRLDRKSFLTYSILRALVIITAIRCFIQGNYESVALCILSLFLFLLPSFFEEQLKVEVPTVFEIIIYVFIYAAEILGEVNRYYTTIPGWDTMLHTINGFLCAAIGFSLVDILNRKSSRIELSPFYLAIVAFCFSMTVGVCWEFIEFSVDQTLYLDMQKDYIVQDIGSVTLDPTHTQTPVQIHDIVKTVIETADGKTYTIDGGYLDIGIIDTMKDLFVNFVGALTFSVIGYLYVKRRDAKEKQTRTSEIAEKLMLKTITDDDLRKQNEAILEYHRENDDEPLRQRLKNNMPKRPEPGPKRGKTSGLEHAESESGEDAAGAAEKKEDREEENREAKYRNSGTGNPAESSGHSPAGQQEI